MRVFLTGGSGYLGGRIGRALLDAGHEVVALARDRGRAASLAGCGARIVEGDLLDATAWADTLSTCEGLVHAAGLVRSWGPPPEEFERVNVSATLDLLGHARGAGVGRVVVTASLFALGPSNGGEPRDESALEEAVPAVLARSDYARTKAVMARRVRDRQRHGDPAMLVLPTVLVGPGSLTEGNHTAAVLSDLARGRLPGLIGSGDQTWDLVGVDDAARGHVLALEHGTAGGAYLLGGEGWTQRRLVEHAAARFGVRAPGRSLGRRLPLLVAGMCEAWAAASGREPALTRGQVDLYCRSWSFRSDRARSELGYAPEPVAGVVDRTVDWLREEILPGDAGDVEGR